MMQSINALATILPNANSNAEDPRKMAVEELQLSRERNALSEKDLNMFSEELEGKDSPSL